MKVKELIERLQEFDWDMDVFYDDETYWPRETDRVYEITIYKWDMRYHYNKEEWDKEIKCIYIE